jgi:molybdopterin-containing oxidoreductase family membrane subunit
MMNLWRFAAFSLKQIAIGSRGYYAWLLFLGLLMALGIFGVSQQVIHGHIVSNMRDPVPWGMFIGTYAFFVGVAAAAVVLVVPGYIYHWKPIKEIVILGEIIAISALVVCILFVMADLGHPDRFWHLLPGVGAPHVPTSMIATNVMILNGYLILNVVIVTSSLYRAFTGKPQDDKLFLLLVFISIPAAISIHTTTAFIFNVLPARPYWNSAILVPRFITTALCAGPALMVLAFQALRKAHNVVIKDEALFRIVDIVTIVMIVNLFLLFAEVVTEYRSATHHSIHIMYYFQGLDGHLSLRGWAWGGVACNVVAMLLFMIPATRRNFVTINIGCVLTIIGVWVEKGIGLILPGLTPGLLGEIYEYTPSLPEVMIALGILATGALIFTVFSRVAGPLVLSDLEDS